PEPLLGRVHEPIGVLPLRGIGHHAVNRGSARFQLLHRLLEPVGVASRDYHARSVLAEPGGDGGADSPAAARDDGHLALEGARRHVLASASSARSRPSGSSTESALASGTMRLTNPVSTRPGPTSRKVSAPSAASRSTHAVHCTGLAIWRSRNGTTSPAARVTPASTLRTRGIVGSAILSAARSGARRSPAGAISAQWNGALTGSSTLLRPPRSLASATA